MNQPFILSDVLHFETLLETGGQARLLHILAKRCAALQRDGLLSEPEKQVRIRLDLLQVAREMGFPEGEPALRGTQFDGDCAQRHFVWECIKRGEKFVQFNDYEGDYPTGRFAMVWFHLGGTFAPAEPPKPENLQEVTVGINADFVDAMVQYGQALLAEEAGAV